MPSSPSEMLAELEAVIAGVPEPDRKHDTPAVNATIHAWLRTLTAERAEPLRTGLRGWLSGDNSRRVSLALDIAEMWRDEDLMNAAVCEARRRLDVEATGQDPLSIPVTLNVSLSGALAEFPVPAGVTYLRELAKRLSTATRKNERLICARAAISLCYIEQRPISCLEPILATLRGWEDRRLAVVPVGLMWALYGSRRGEKRALAAILRPDERERVGM